MTGHPDQNFGDRSYAQGGEDLAVLNLFKLLEVEKPSYLDIGAHDGMTISNTRLLYERGCRGVCVEANPALIPSLLAARPQDRVVNVGVAPQAGKLTFNVFDDTSGRNTFSPAEVVAQLGEREVRSQILLDVVTIDEIVHAWCGGLWPDFLSIDIEGLDYGVLETAKLHKSAPMVICAEARQGDGNDWDRMMGFKGYYRHSRCGDNLLFVRIDIGSRVY